MSFFDRWQGVGEELEKDPEDSGTQYGAAAALRTIAGDWERLTQIQGPARQAYRLADRIQRGDVAGISIRLEEALDAFRDELERTLFLGLNREEAVLYVVRDLEEVGERFPSARQEVEDASRCLALALPTASAFHSIRALEVVLGVLARELNIPTGQNWHNAIQQIEAELKRRRESKENDDRTWQRQWGRFYAESAQHFMHLKTAHRNPTMHWSTETIDDRRARQLREHTIQLIEAVSKRLSEVAPTEPELPSGRSPGAVQD